MTDFEKFSKFFVKNGIMTDPGGAAKGGWQNDGLFRLHIGGCNFIFNPKEEYVGFDDLTGRFHPRFKGKLQTWTGFFKEGKDREQL